MDKSQLLFASSNLHKLGEIRAMLPPQLSLIGLRDINWSLDIPEPYDTFAQNAKAKASFVFLRTGITCFAEDSGLVVDALDGRPGAFSARYAGDHGDSDANNQKVLRELTGITHRNARYVAVIAFVSGKGALQFFRGTVEGSIADQPRGHAGFGYDPIFIPSGFNATFGELPGSVKQSISHRRKAITAFIDHVRTNEVIR